MPSTDAVTRPPRQERSRLTRQRLLVSTVDSLAELGWARTTVASVATRAGVSRGAAQHHFATREALVTAALEHIAEVRLEAIRTQATQLRRQGDRTVAAIELLVEIYTGPLFRAALQVWVAASADERLREQIVPLETTLARAAHEVALDLLGADERRPEVRATVQGVLDLARGLGLADVLTDDSRRRAAIITQWSAMVDSALTAR